MKKLNPELLRAHKGVSFVGVTTSALCHDGKGNFLMMKRGPLARDENGRWDILGGGLKQGTPVEENLRRELEEELCTTAEEIIYLGYRDVHRKLDDGTPTHWISIDHIMKIDRDKTKIGEPGVIDEIGWFTTESIPSPLHSQFMVFFENNKAAIISNLLPDGA
jgi:ADP-ribose pyrophosphatase YjhB (NUDIX family)